MCVSTYMLFNIHVPVCMTIFFFFRPQKASSLQEAVVNHVDGHATSVSKPAPLNQVKAVSKKYQFQNQYFFILYCYILELSIINV